MTPLGILFVGSTDAGKCAALRTLSETAFDEDAALLQTTMRTDDDSLLRLYAIPEGETGADALGKIAQDLIGVILLVDNRRPNPLADLRLHLDMQRELIARSGVAIGVTHMDEKEQPLLNTYHHWMTELSVRAPVFEVDARYKQDLSVLVQALLLTMDKAA